MLWQNGILISLLHTWANIYLRQRSGVEVAEKPTQHGCSKTIPCSCETRRELYRGNFLRPKGRMEIIIKMLIINYILILLVLLTISKSWLTAGARSEIIRGGNASRNDGWGGLAGQKVTKSLEKLVQRESNKRSSVSGGRTRIGFIVSTSRRSFYMRTKLLRSSWTTLMRYIGWSDGRDA